jgi:DNA-binding transcriptional ArsR family regulator
MASSKFSHLNLGPILRALVDGPLTTVQLQAKTGISIQTARSICKSLHKAKLLHIAHWHVSNSTYLPAYRFAEGTDASKDDRLCPSQTKILALLEAQPARYHLAENIGEKIKLSTRTVLLQLNALERKGLVSSRDTLPKQWRCCLLVPKRKAAATAGTDGTEVQKPAPRPKADPQSWFSVLGVKS